MERLISVTITDKEGSRSDTIDIELNAGQNVAVPRKKAMIACWLGYAENDGDVSGLDYFGTFTADDVELQFIPYKIKVQGKSADMRDTLKQHKERHWDNSTFGQVVSQIAGENGLSAQVDPALANFKGRDGYFAQEAESGLHWIERHAKKLNGLFAIKDGRLIVGNKGSGLTALGAAIGGLVVRPPMILTGTGSVKWTGRESHKEVEGGYHDMGEAKRKFEKAPANADGTAKYRLRHQFANKDEAKRAAESTAKDLQRSAMTTNVGIIGETRARGGGGMTYADVHPEIDGQPFVIETAAHTYTKAGYTTKIDAKTQV